MSRPRPPRPGAAPRGGDEAPAASADVEAGPPVGSGAAHLHATRAAPDPHEERTLATRATAAFAWWQTTRVARALARFSARGGGVLSGGIAYAALFSIFAAVAIGYTVLMVVLRGNDELREQVLETVGEALPGLIKGADGVGLIDPTELTISTTLTVTGIVALVVLLLSALAAVAAVRIGIRAMFGEDGPHGNAVTSKLRELGGFVGIGIAVLVSAVLTTGVAAGVQWLLDVLGMDAATAGAVRLAGIAVAFVVDALVFVLMVGVLAGEQPPRKDMVQGALIAATAFGVVRVLGTQLVAGSVGRNPLLASFAVIVTLLVWVNLIARLLLMTAAWVADPPQVERRRGRGSVT